MSVENQDSPDLRWKGWEIRFCEEAERQLVHALVVWNGGIADSRIMRGKDLETLVATVRNEKATGEIWLADPQWHDTPTGPWLFKKVSTGSKPPSLGSGRETPPRWWHGGLLELPQV